MKIKEAAIRLEDGRVFTGRRHGDVLRKIKAAGVDRLVSVHGIHGFVTECGQFVTRAEAAVVAFDAGQTPKLLSGLTSEDLY